MARNYGGICHTWAAQVKPRGKNGNIFFEGTRIYSYGYHYLMANFVRPDVVLVNSNGYSSSTQSHKRAVYDALRGLPVKVFEVPTPAPVGEHDHRTNIQSFATAYGQALATAGRARKHQVMSLEAAVRYRQYAIDYAETFGIEFTAPQPVNEGTMAAATQLAREAAKKEQAKNAERKRFIAIVLAEKIVEWRAGTRSSLPYDHGDTLLRVRGEEIQTSRGARVPLSVAPWLWGMVSACRENNHTLTERNISRYRVGDFELREISTEGDLTIGCHIIKYPELERLAKELGLCKSETTPFHDTTSTHASIS